MTFPPTYSHNAGSFDGTGDSRTLFGQTMSLVAVTTGLFALGAYLGPSLSYGWGSVWFIAAFRMPDWYEIHCPADNFVVFGGIAARLRVDARTGDGTDRRLLRQHWSGGLVGVRRSHRSVHGWP